MSDADDQLRATTLLLEAQLASRGLSRPPDDETLRELVAASGAEFRLALALVQTLEIDRGLVLATGSHPEPAELAAGARPAGADLAGNLARTAASPPPLPSLAAADLDGLLPRLESVLARSREPGGPA
jgi:hypothetical protein